MSPDQPMQRREVPGGEVVHVVVAGELADLAVVDLASSSLSKAASAASIGGLGRVDRP